MDISGELCVSTSCISSSDSVQVSGGTCHGSIQAFYSGGTMLHVVSWFHTLCGILEYIPYETLTIKSLIMDVLVDQILRSLQSLHLILWLSIDVLHIQKFPFSVCQAVAMTHASTANIFQQCWKKWTSLCTQESVLKNTISSLNLYEYYGYTGLAHIGIYHAATVAFFVESLSSQGFKSSDHL